MSDPAARTLVEAVTAAGLALEPVGEHRWYTVITGEWKRTIPVLFSLGDRRLTVTSLFAAAPEEAQTAVYRLLLQRNQHAGMVHFALDDSGDLILTGRLPRAAIDPGHLDELLGQLLTMADETYNQVLRTGFATYLAAEQRWRASVGLPPNPVGDPLSVER